MRNTRFRVVISLVIGIAGIGLYLFIVKINHGRPPSDANFYKHQKPSTDLGNKELRISNATSAGLSVKRNRYINSRTDKGTLWIELRKALAETDPVRWIENFHEALEYLLKCQWPEQGAVLATITAALREEHSPDELAQLFEQNADDLSRGTRNAILADRSNVWEVLLQELINVFFQQNRLEDLRAFIGASQKPAIKEELTGLIVGAQISNNYPGSIGLLNGMESIRSREVAEIKILKNLVLSNRADALRFVLREDCAIQNDNVYANSIFNFSWFREKPEEASTILKEASPSNRRDAMIVEMLKAMDGSDSGAAKAWINAISDPERRKSAEKEFGR